MAQYKRVETADLSLSGRPVDTTFHSIKAIDIRNINDDISLGVSCDLDPTNHSMLLDRITKRGADVIEIFSEHLPALPGKEFPWLKQKNPSHRPDADLLSARFHREIFLYEVRAFMLAQDLPLHNIRVYNLHLGKERRHLVIIDTDFADSEMSEVYRWRDRIQKRHGVNIRFNRDSDALSPVEKFLKTAQRRGVIGPEQTVDDLVPGLANPAEQDRGKYPLEDHRRIPLLSIDDSKIQNREDAHLGVKLEQGFYVDTHVPLYELPNEGFKKGRDVLTIAIGYEITPSGELGECHVRQALARNYLPLRFGDVGSLEHSYSLPEPFSNSISTLFNAAQAHRSNVGLGGRNKQVTFGMNSAEMVAELMIASERVFAQECARLNIPVIVKRLDDSDNRALTAIEKMLDMKRETLGSWLSLTLGNSILHFKDSNSEEMIRFILNERLNNHSFLVQEPNAHHHLHRARAKARGLEGQINQRQWVSHIRGKELAYSVDELHSACHILNERYVSRHHRLVSTIESIPKGLSSKIGQVFEATLVNTAREIIVLSPAIETLGKLNRGELLREGQLRGSQEIFKAPVRFLGFDLNQGELIFEPAEPIELVA